jgi:predicted nucleic acid-binding protein
VHLLDASVWVAAKDGGDPFFEPARGLAIDPALPVAALDLTLYEIANALGVRRGRRQEAVDLCLLVARRCGAQLLRVETDLMAAGLASAAEHGLSAYDATYVAAAQRYGWTLVSTDIRDLVSKGLAVTPDSADYP